MRNNLEINGHDLKNIASPKKTTSPTFRLGFISARQLAAPVRLVPKKELAAMEARPQERRLPQNRQDTVQLLIRWNEISGISEHQRERHLSCHATPLKNQSIKLKHIA